MVYTFCLQVQDSIADMTATMNATSNVPRHHATVWGESLGLSARQLTLPLFRRFQTESLAMMNRYLAMGESEDSETEAQTQAQTQAQSHSYQHPRTQAQGRSYETWPAPDYPQRVASAPGSFPFGTTVRYFFSITTSILYITIIYSKTVKLYIIIHLQHALINKYPIIIIQH